jgi:hypothetical protein
MLSHTNLTIYYNKVFGMAQHHKYSIFDIETLMPFERDLYYDLLVSYIKEEQEKNKKRK